MPIKNYLARLNQRYQLGNATEHTFRGDLQQLIEILLPHISATNEPKRQACGAPDYILTRKEIPVGFIEAKDIGDPDLDGLKRTGNKGQFDRYKASLNNLIFTDYLNFHLYREGEFVTKVSIARLNSKGIEPLPENFDAFKDLINEFSLHVGQTIKSPKKLAEMMAGKARLLSDVIERSLTSDEQTRQDSSLKDQMLAFKEILIHDITPKGFADVYAQTIAYGMFAARLHDPTLPTFSRQEAAELIPKSNPFLRKLFGYIAGPDIDDRIKWIVDGLAEVFLACNVEKILKNYGKATKMEDPIIHFYETFLSEYDPKLRKARGVWYTPQPVVDFIVRAVDDILKTEFNLPQGLADTSKTRISLDTQTPDKRSATGYRQVEQEVHRVQVLDPATGTGTFLAQVVKHIHKKFEGQEGIWSNYVEKHLLPRLNGFELLMASYAMAHLKLDLLFRETGYHPQSDQRLRVYLTNSLEEHHPDTGTLFANWLSLEANEANQIKRDAPVMVVLGNPPYSGESANKGKWIMDLMEDYKKEPGGKEKLKERNSKWINDDYVKFLRYGQHFIEKNGSGVLAFINPHGFLDNPTFRGMRWNLIKTFDKIYSIDLHGNSKKKETAPDGSSDENVFDIMQGVSINILIKTGKKKPTELGEVLHYDLYGKRDGKYNFLIENSLKSIEYKKLEPIAPNYFFIPVGYESIKDYNQGFAISDLFKIQSMGITSARDSFVIDIDKEVLFKRINEFTNPDFSDNTIRENFFGTKKEGKYKKGDTRGWKMTMARSSVTENNHSDYIKKISYRPFDDRFIYYSSDMVDWDRKEVMMHLLKPNIALTMVKLGRDSNAHNYFLSKHITDKSISSSLDNSNVFPLYLYSKKSLPNPDSYEIQPNFNEQVVIKFAKSINHIYYFGVDQHCDLEEGVERGFNALDLLDYIYAVLHSPSYREKYKEFLKIDFPRVPYPKDADSFWKLVKLGSQLRGIHLLESPVVEQFITTYPIGGDNTITRKLTKNSPGFELTHPEKGLGKVWINDEQYFDKVPQNAWEFYIGGYQPAQKWLKDRTGRSLDFEEIQHYQKIIMALRETERLMGEIDGLKFTE